MDDNGWVLGLILFFFVVIVPVIMVLTESAKNKKKAEANEDKIKIQNFFKSIMPEYENYTIAYAYWYAHKFEGRASVRTYWNYGIAFNSDRIYIVPLAIADGEMNFKQVSCIEKSYIGRVEPDVKFGKIKLFDKNNQLIISLWVEPKSMYDFINIYQEKEAKAFVQFIEQWTREING